jgi:glycosyltransferase involved in cell wall biosynthesis
VDRKRKIRYNSNKTIGVFCLILSIIIPYYKTYDLTCKLLNKLIDQRLNGVDIILVDDGCNEKRLDKYSHSVKIIHQKNEGVSEARNKGVQHAKGEYITFIDSDDMVSGDYTSTVLSKCKYGDFDYCTFGWRWRNGTIKTAPPKWNTSVWNCIYKLNKSIKFPSNKSIGEDADYNKLARKGKADHIDKVLYYYNHGREGSLTTEYNKPKSQKSRESRGVIKAQLIIYQRAFNIIGGLETSLYEFVKAFHDKYEIKVLYDFGAVEQLCRLRKYVECIEYKSQQVECDKYICWSNQRNIADNVTSKDNFYAIIIHADYKALGWPYKKHNKTNVHIAVSEVAKKGCDLKDCEVIYNLLDIDTEQKALNLISCTRLSVEKGHNKMIQFARRLKEKNIPFTWQVFTDMQKSKVSKEDDEGFSYRFPVQDDAPYIKSADYYITCSDTESWGYSTAKAFELGTTVVSTDYPALHEQGAKENENCYILKQDMSNLDDIIDKMLYNDIKGFAYRKLDNPKQWDKLLNLKEKKTDYEPDTSVYMVAKRQLFLIEENLNVKFGETFKVGSWERASKIKKLGYAEIK